MIWGHPLKGGSSEKTPLPMKKIGIGNGVKKSRHCYYSWLALHNSKSETQAKMNSYQKELGF